MKISFQKVAYTGIQIVAHAKPSSATNMNDTFLHILPYIGQDWVTVNKLTVTNFLALYFPTVLITSKKEL